MKLYQGKKEMEKLSDRFRGIVKRINKLMSGGKLHTQKLQGFIVAIVFTKNLKVIKYCTGKTTLDKSQKLKKRYKKSHKDCCC